MRTKADLCTRQHTWIDTSRIRRWLDRCDQTHGHECLRSYLQKRDSDLKNILLVDVEEGCLVQLPSTTRYFALSYVWGQIAAVTETRKDNIDALRKKGSVTIESTLLRLPETIRDALRLLRRLGERYLWVDRLCIVQDDEKNKLLHVLNMDTIFLNAYCTIVAADGTDANWGLPGVGSGSCPRHFPPQRTLNIGGFLIQTAADAKWKNSHHATRGWTFQEMFLTRRYIVFSRNTVVWQCQKSIWQEDCSEKLGCIPWISTEMTLHMDPWPNLFAWSTAVKEYNTRNLTFPKDMQTAFAGVEKSLEKSFPRGFIYGLPEFFFNLAMLWQPGPDSSSRRGAQHRTISGYAVPSWSWMGWTGEIDNDFVLYTVKYWRYVEWSRSDAFNPHVELEPLFDWYQVDPYTGNQRRIRNDYHEWRARARASAVPPDGWTRNVSTDGIEYYTTAAAPDLAFRYPIPKAAEIPPEPAQLSWPPYLQFRSHRAKFKIAAHDKRDRQDVIMVDARGSKSGGLRVILRDPEAALIGQECELVAISKVRGKINNFVCWPGFPREVVEDFNEEMDSDNLYEFYNVLWIKWEGEYAVREALGHIEKSAWERQDLEEIDVQLR